MSKCDMSNDFDNGEITLDRYKMQNKTVFTLHMMKLAIRVSQ